MINRRELLKLSSVVPVSTIPGLNKRNEGSAFDQDIYNIIIIVFDAFSAKNIPFYGYPRNTTPYLSKLLDRAVVYHRHYAGGNFTTPGTASLFTGVYPWSHRAINIGNKVIKKFETNNIFSVLNDHYRMAYTHNLLAHTLLYQFKGNIDFLHNPEKLYLTPYWPGAIFKPDSDIAKLSFSRVFKKGRGLGKSLFLQSLYNFEPMTEWLEKKEIEISSEYREDFPRGLPLPASSYIEYFTIEDAIDWLQDEVIKLPNPFLTYFHLLPPHARYRTRKEFIDKFLDDGFRAAQKPVHILRDPGADSPKRYIQDRQFYDEYILYVDAEFNRLYQYLEKNRILENTILLFTSDHGEIFERGYHKHSGETLHEPIINIPLVIFHPDIDRRVDIFESTSAVDILPTLQFMAGKPTNGLTDGIVLPPFNEIMPNRDVFALQAQGNQQKKKFAFGTGMISRDQYKLTYYFGYPQLEGIGTYVELYDVVNDPEELENLFMPNDKLTKELLSSLITKMEEADKPYS